jgi:hypothetical protein
MKFTPRTRRISNLLAIAILILCLTTKSFGANVINYETAGNLKSNNDLECIGPEKLNNEYTPPELYKAVTKCVAQDKYKEGILLFSLAGVYGRFDTFRVADKTAHQAITILLMGTFDSLSENKKNIFIKALKKMFYTPNELATCCKQIVLIGPPNYYPDYMIQHGMGAFFNDGSNNGIVSNFDAQTAWKEVVGIYLHCPGYKNTSDTES